MRALLPQGDGTNPRYKLLCLFPFFTSSKEQNILAMNQYNCHSISLFYCFLSSVYNNQFIKLLIAILFIADYFP
jgi:hypothetical protein